jgi:hypothetical protein
LTIIDISSFVPVPEAANVALFLLVGALVYAGRMRDERKVVCGTTHENSETRSVWLHTDGLVAIFKRDGCLRSKQYINYITSRIIMFQCWAGNVTEQ